MRDTNSATVVDFGCQDSFLGFVTHVKIEVVVISIFVQIMFCKQFCRAHESPKVLLM